MNRYEIKYKRRSFGKEVYTSYVAAKNVFKARKMAAKNKPDLVVKSIRKVK